jgi:hypothetical protein
MHLLCISGLDSPTLSFGKAKDSFDLSKPAKNLFLDAKLGTQALPAGVGAVIAFRALQARAACRQTSCHGVHLDPGRVSGSARAPNRL